MIDRERESMSEKLQKLQRSFTMIWVLSAVLLIITSSALTGGLFSAQILGGDCRRVICLKSLHCYVTNVFLKTSDSSSSG